MSENEKMTCDVSDVGRTDRVESLKPLRSGRQPAPLITIIEKT